MDGRTEIRAKLLADSTVTTQLGLYATLPAIFDAPVAPDQYADNCLTMYLTAPTNGGLDIGIYQNTVNCYAKTYQEAESIQESVYSSLNRHSEGANTVFTCSKQVIIESGVTGSDYNAPVEVTVKQR